MNTNYREATPADYGWIIESVDEWWGKSVSAALPRYFLDHFHNTSLVAERAGIPVGFLVGFFSPAQTDTAYIHFVGVRPAERKSGIAAAMYQRFFDLVLTDDRDCVNAITSPDNGGSIRFHERMGFAVSERIDDYNALGVARVLFTRRL